MADGSFIGGSFLTLPSLKRRRGEESPQVMSVIEDRRITASQGLRLDCDFLTIKVGPPDSEDPNAQEEFKVHEYALCDRSEYFANAMKPEWASLRPDPRVLELPDDDPEAFALYRTWLYSGKLPILPDDPNDASAAQEGYNVLAYAYVLGERLCDTAFKNAIADTYVIYARGNQPAKRYYPSNEEIRIIYEGTRPDSPIRQLLVDIWYSRGRADWTEGEGADELPRDFLLSVTKALFKVRQAGREAGKVTDGVSRPWKGSHVQYHEKEV